MNHYINLRPHESVTILEGRQTQFCRVIKLKNGDYFNIRQIICGECYDFDDRPFYGFNSENEEYKCPLGKPGRTGASRG